MAAFRYWRLFISEVNGPANGDYCTISEVQLRTASGSGDVTTSSTPVTASSNYPSQPPTNVVDKNNITQWSTALQNVNASNPAWLIFDLGSPQTIVEMTIRASGIDPVSRLPKKFALQASEDGVNWPVFSQVIADQTGWSMNQVRTFPVSIFYVAGNAKLDTGIKADRVIMVNWNAPYNLINSVVPASNGDWRMMTDTSPVLITILGPTGYQPISHGPITSVT